MPCVFGVCRYQYSFATTTTATTTSGVRMFTTHGMVIISSIGHRVRDEESGKMCESRRHYDINRVWATLSYRSGPVFRPLKSGGPENLNYNDLNHT